LGAISWLSFSIPKAGNTALENEDAVFPNPGVGMNGHDEVVSFAVADGATQTSFSNLWANCLVNSCSTSHLSEPAFLRAVGKAQVEWQQSLQGIELPWHAQEKFRQGAFSALAWLEIQYYPLQPAYPFTWRALAVGDCCLFIASNYNVYLSLPLQNFAEFNNSPILIPSKSEKMESIKGMIQTARGSLRMGDQLILASDAISSWIMKQSQESHKDFIKMVLSYKSSRNSDGFVRWVQNLRKKNEIKNDDTSLILIELGEVIE
jgi:hypothetical protein